MSLIPLLRRSSISEDEFARDLLSVSKSVVKIYTSSSSPVQNQPWQLARGQTSSSTGFIIQFRGAKYILTNAHALAFFTSVQVKKIVGRKYSAKVLCISDCNDLALMTVENPDFWRNAPALPIGSLPGINDPLTVVGYPLGAEEITFSSGAANRISINSFAHSGEQFLVITTDASLNPGNSGGPIVSCQDGIFKAVGVAFETLPSANSVSFAIAPTVVNHFLESFAIDNFGTSSLNITTQSIESQVMRDALLIPPLSGLVNYFHGLATPTLALDGRDSGSGSPKNNNNTVKQHFSARNRRQSMSSSEICKAQLTIIEADDEFDYVVFHSVDPSSSNIEVLRPDGQRHTPIYRIQRPPPTAQSEKIPESLKHYLTSEQVNDTAIGIRVGGVVPFSSAAQFLQAGDVILTINDVPIGSDQTILLRGTERVKFIHLLNNMQLGDMARVVISRGFDILRFEIPIQDKQYIAKWSQYKTPQYLVALGMVFVPLTSNLMAAEYGSAWDSIAPVPLLESLFTGTQQRKYEDEEVVVLTQILAHPSTEGYDQSMRRVTKINGQPVINLKHLATLIRGAVRTYEESEFAQFAASALSPTASLPPMNSLPEDDEIVVTTTGQDDDNKDDMDGSSPLTPLSLPTKQSPLGKLINATPDQQQHQQHQQYDPSSSDDDSRPRVGETIATMDDLQRTNSFFQAQAYSEYCSLFNSEIDLKFLTITLQNEQNIILSLENGKHTHLDILTQHQIPVPGASRQILPMYDLVLSIAGEENQPLALSSKSTPRSSHVTPPSKPGLTPLQTESMNRPGVGPHAPFSQVSMEEKIYKAPLHKHAAFASSSSTTTVPTPATELQPTATPINQTAPTTLQSEPQHQSGISVILNSPSSADTDLNTFETITNKTQSLLFDRANLNNNRRPDDVTPIDKCLASNLHAHAHTSRAGLSSTKTPLQQPMDYTNQCKANYDNNHGNKNKRKK